MQALDAVDFDGCGAVAPDIRAHGDQALGQVHHFRFTGGVLQDGFTLCQRSSHHQVFCAGYRNRVEEDVGAPEAAIGFGLDVTILDPDIRAHHFQAVDVQVYRAATNGAATRQGHFRFAKMSHQRAQHEDGRPHGFDQLVRRVELLDGIGVDFHAHLLINDHFNAHAAQQLDHGGHVVQVWQVADGHRLVCQKCRRQNRQRGVLGAGNPDFTIQGLAAPDQKFVHNKVPVL